MRIYEWILDGTKLHHNIIVIGIKLNYYSIIDMIEVLKKYLRFLSNSINYQYIHSHTNLNVPYQ
jgi:hypothetical protein